MPAQLRQRKNSRARRLAKGCEQQQPCARVWGTSGKRPVAKFLARGKAKAKSWADIKLALRARWLSNTLASRKRAPRCKECRLDCAKPRRIEENPRAAGRLQKQPRDFERLETEIHGRATKKTPSSRNHDTATQNKARAREEPSPGPPVSETDARPLGHQPRGGAPARPRLSRSQEAPP